MQEREVKLVVRNGVQLPSPRALLDGIGDWSVDEIEQDATYFDTRDLALTRAGASLRYRSDDGWTVKIPRRREGASFTRDEYGFDGGSGDPPGAALDLVHAWSRSRPVVEVARVHTKRQRIRVHDGDGSLVVEVDEDDVTGSVDGRRTRFREVEIEAKSEDAPRVVDALVARLVKSGAEERGSMPKVARVLGPPASEPPDLVAPDRLAKSATVAQLVATSLARSVRQLLDHDPLVRVGEDPEGVHQARVATRRLRSDLRTFRPVLDAGWIEPLRAELSWLGEMLGRVRDADVLLDRLATNADSLAADDRATASELLDRLRETRERDRVSLLDAMRSDRYTTLLDRLVEAARRPRVHDHGGDQRASKVVRRLARQPWKRLRQAISRLPADPADADLHEVRKRAKQARYAFEAVTPIAGRRAARGAKRLADLQDMLGDHQDAVVAAAWLHDAARAASGVEVPFVAGRLAGLFDTERRRLRARWLDAWKRAQRS
jgi:CHAD domain-containing protein